MFSPSRHSRAMDMGFSRRIGQQSQRRGQADQLASLLASIAARQATTPTARAQTGGMRIETKPECAFHTGIARAMLTPRQDS
jgi:histone acetyltransferase (RNA polymerase elongator complex component)